MKFALAFTFSNFDVAFRFEGQLFAMVTIGLLTALAMIVVWRKHKT
jgi:hypothetical protein